jgi:3-phenylpropionate/trans-cinnamate dioxygenase ferredoxin reductase subunit
MAEAGIVIVGASHAGVTLAGTLRQKKVTGPVTLIGAEASLPYHRPPLSKDLLTGEADEAGIALRARNFYADQAIELRLDTRVTAVHPGARTLTLSDGRELAYSQLVLATGARARDLPVPGAELPGVHSLRSLNDARALAARIAAGTRMVIVGAGYIGLEVAACARTLGVEVTVVEQAPRALARVASPIVADWARNRHERRGVRFRFDAGVAEIAGGPDGVDRVRLADGGELPADLVLVGIGAVPNTELAAEAGLALDDGIAVDATLRSSDSGIFAIGDAASFPCRWTGRRRRLESVQNAQDQARALATTLSGAHPAAYDALPWFWSNQGPDKLQSAGTPHPDAELRVEGDPDDDRFTVRHLLQGRVIASESVNDPKAHMKTRREIEPLAERVTV